LTGRPLHDDAQIDAAARVHAVVPLLALVGRDDGDGDGDQAAAAAAAAAAAEAAVAASARLFGVTQESVAALAATEIFARVMLACLDGRSAADAVEAALAAASPACPEEAAPIFQGFRDGLQVISTPPTTAKTTHSGAGSAGGGKSVQDAASLARGYQDVVDMFGGGLVGCVRACGRGTRVRL
jgi:hypothetical protein